MAYIPRKGSPELEELAAYAIIWQEKGVGARTVSSRIAEHGSALAALRAGQGDLFKGPDKKVTDEIERLKFVSFDWTAIGIDDSLYPQVLRTLINPPYYLYLCGNIELLRKVNVSIVGTRDPTPDGIARAKRLAKELTTNGIVVTSGLAKGIDTAALTAAFDAGGTPIAVIGTPLDKEYPAENRGLQNRIKASGLLVSQYPFGIPTGRGNFPERNRTMAAISAATAVIEAGETSGVRSQVTFCLQVQRPLFLAESLTKKGLPWVDTAFKGGARLLNSTTQVIEAISLIEAA